jgi:hypothetical protein
LFLQKQRGAQRTKLFSSYRAKQQNTRQHMINDVVQQQTGTFISGPHEKSQNLKTMTTSEKRGQTYNEKQHPDHQFARRTG